MSDKTLIPTMNLKLVVSESYFGGNIPIPSYSLLQMFYKNEKPIWKEVEFISRHEAAKLIEKC